MARSTLGTLCDSWEYDNRFILFGGDPSESFFTPVVTAVTDNPSTPGEWMWYFTGGLSTQDPSAGVRKALPAAEEGPSSRPPMMSFASAVVTEVGEMDDQQQQQGLYLIVFGGVGRDRVSVGGHHPRSFRSAVARTQSSETYAFDLNQRRWRRFFFPHGGPPPRHNSGLCISPLNDSEVLLFGGISDPERLRRSDLWSLDLSKVDWSYHSIPSQCDSIGGAVWRKVKVGSCSTALRPSPRDKFALTASPGSIYLFGVEWDRSLSDELWRLDCSTYEWELLETKGSPPPPCQGADGSSWLWSIGDSELLLLPNDAASLYALDLNNHYWSDHCHGLPDDSIAFQVSGLDVERAKRQGLILFDNSVASISIEDDEGPVKVAPSRERRQPMVVQDDAMIRDAEEQVMKSKKEVLALAEDMAALGTDRGRLIAELENMRQQAELDRRSIREAKSRIQTLEEDVRNAENLLKDSEGREAELRGRVARRGKLDDSLRRLCGMIADKRWNEAKIVATEAQELLKPSYGTNVPMGTRAPATTGGRKAGSRDSTTR
ncbi:Kelch domain containing [Perkinsus olseni]|uniref:Kelch domain containing n=1 Tax=Perkinsus olseni TaxID=32597 RepID=A0A7J6TE61_PEROL|nr:Kelch domain containing [Perkinsus olseni]